MTVYPLATAALIPAKNKGPPKRALVLNQVLRRTAVNLPVFVILMPMSVVHLLAMKFGAMICRVLPACREIAMIPVAIVESMIHMTMEPARTVEPGTRSNKHSARIPLRTIISIWGAVIRRSLVVSIRTNRRFTNLHRNLSRSFGARR
jgi:hypothetical protein